MSKVTDELQDQIDALEAKKLERERFESKLGTANVQADEYHNAVCRFDHTERCNYGYEGPEQFDRVGSTKNRFKTAYAEKKKAVEGVFGVTVSHEEFMELIKTLRFL